MATATVTASHDIATTEAVLANWNIMTPEFIMNVSSSYKEFVMQGKIESSIVIAMLYHF
jgi:hypothetical protein